MVRRLIMSGKLTFKVESQGRPYGVMVLRQGLVTVRIGRIVLQNALLSHAVQWVKDRNPCPGSEVRISIVGHF
jgi:hypothetical protein